MFRTKSSVNKTTDLDRENKGLKALTREWQTGGESTPEKGHTEPWSACPWRNCLDRTVPRGRGQGPGRKLPSHHPKESVTECRPARTTGN